MVQIRDAPEGYLLANYIAFFSEQVGNNHMLKVITESL